MHGPTSRIVAVACALALAVAAVPATSSGNVAVTATEALSAPSASASQIRAAASGDGRVAVALWLSRTEAGTSVQTTVLRGGSWGAPSTLAGPSAPVDGPDVAVSADGTAAVAAWLQGPPGATVVHAAFLAAGRWQPPVPVSAPGARNCRIVLAADGTAHAVWDRATPTGWRVESAQGTAAGWQVPRALSTDMAAAGGPVIALASRSGAAMAVWQHQSGTPPEAVTTIESSLRNAAGWAPAQTVAAAAGRALSLGPQVAVSADGSAAQAVWTDTAATKSIRSARWSVSGWGTADVLSGTDNGSYGYSVSVSADGSGAWVVFSSQSGGTYRVRARQRTSAGWGAPIALSDGDRQSVLPDLSVSPDGRDGAAVWRETVLGQPHVRVAALRQGRWLPATDLPDAAASAEPRLALSARGRAGWVVWSPETRLAGSRDDAGGAVARAVALVTPPDPPTGAAARPVASGAAVAWQPPPDTGVPVVSYTAVASPGGRNCTSSLSGCTITGLAGGRTYRVSVVATNAAGASEPAVAGEVRVAGVKRAGQSVAPPPRRIRKGTRSRLAPLTRQRVATAWRSRSKRVCAVKVGRVVALRVGTCRLRVAAPATREFEALRAGFVVRVWRPRKSAKKPAAAGRTGPEGSRGRPS